MKNNNYLFNNYKKDNYYFWMYSLNFNINKIRNKKIFKYYLIVFLNYIL